MKRVNAVSCLDDPSPVGGHAADVGFIEDFALARDRSRVLKKLIPAPRTYYYYHCLHYLNTEQYENWPRSPTLARTLRSDRAPH